MSKKPSSNPPLPPGNLHTEDLPVKKVKSTEWFRIFRNNHPKTIAKYFSKDASGRFDDPDKTFGVLYLSKAVHGAFVETLLRNPDPKVQQLIDEQELAIRSVAVFRGDELNLIDLSGSGLVKLKIDLAILATRNYSVPQAWAAALYRHPIAPDGILYRSRHDPSYLCAAIFERAGQKMTKVSEEPFASQRGWNMIKPSFAKYNVGLIANGIPVLPPMPTYLTGAGAAVMKPKKKKP